MIHNNISKMKALNKKHMIKILSILIFCSFFISCSNGKSKKEILLDSLRIENELLKESLLELEIQRNQIKYVWTLIEHKRGKYFFGSSEGNGGFEGPLTNYIFYSDIIEVSGFNEEKEYRLQDELEKELRSQFGLSLHSIQKRETFVFDTYKQASEHRYNFLNK